MSAMTLFVVILSSMACMFAISVAALCWLFARAPGWAHRRWFSAVALTGAAFSAADIPLLLGASDAVVRFNSQLQLMLGCLHVAAWISYAAACEGRSPGRAARAAQLGLLAVGASVFLPGLAQSGPVRGHTFAPLQLTYRSPELTPWGSAVLVLLVLGFLGLTVFYFRAWRRGVREAGAHLVALVLFSAMALSDSLTAAGLISMPYLIDFAFVVPTFAVARVITTRFIEGARALDELRRTLEAQVEARTRALKEAQAALLRSERLAALGEVAACVGQEVSNPLSVVEASVGYLAGALERGERGAEALASVREAREATQRASQVVQKLVSAGRLAVVRPTQAGLELGPLVQEAAARARRACAPAVRFDSGIAPGVWVAGQRDILLQALTSVASHVAQALPAEGGVVRIDTRAAAGAGALVEVLLEADLSKGASTRPETAEVGLAVANELLHSTQGALRIEGGARVVVELPAGAAAAAG
jgi:signal transduction histidine kinase